LESSGTGTTGFANNHNLLFAIISGGAGGGGITTNAVTFNNSGSGAASGTSFNGSTPVTVSYNTLGAQQASASLSSLAALSYASGTPFVKMTAAGTFALDTNTYLTANQTITLSGDGSGSGTTAITLTLATVNSNVGTFNNVTVNAKGLVTSASNVSYLTANQTITLSGNVTGSGTTSITTTIGTNVVTNAMLAQIATARIKGRVTAGTGNVEDLTGTQVTTLLDSFAGSAKGLVPVSVGGTTNFLRADGAWAAPPGGGGGGTTTNALTINNSGSGAASGTTFNGSSAVTISYNTIGAQPLATNLTSLAGLSYASTSFVKMTAAGTFSLDTNTYLTANQTITLSGDVSGSGTTAITTTIGNNVVTLAKFQQISTASFLGRVTAATGNVEVLTGTQATTLLDSFAGSVKGLVPVSVGGTTNFLRADGTWAAPGGGGGGGAFCYFASGVANILPCCNTHTYGFICALSDNTILGGNLNILGNFGVTPVGASPLLSDGTSCSNTIGGGLSNCLCSNTVCCGPVYCPNWGFLYDTIAGGRSNYMGGSPIFDSTISGGCNNRIVGGADCMIGNTIGGGGNNQIAANASFNTFGICWAVIAGGNSNFIRGIGSVIGGGTNNCAVVCSASAFNPVYSSILGGCTNRICGAGACFSSILGGQTNCISSNHSVSFGINNNVTANCSGAFGCALTASVANTYYFNNICVTGTYSGGGFTSSTQGIVPASGGGTTNFLRADGTWAVPAGGGGTTTNAVTFNNGGTGDASGTTFDGSAARTISYNTLGANKVITSGTAAPTGGADGDIYLQYV